MQKERIEFKSSDAEEMWEIMQKSIQGMEAEICFRYIESAILRMQQKMEDEGKSVEEVAKEAMQQTIPLGLTGKAAIQAPFLIRKLWVFGEEYWRWFREFESEYLSKMT